MSTEKRIRVVGLVTARGKNTLANKHQILIANKPLIWYPLNAARKSPSIDKHYISSDDDSILQLGYDEGYEVIKRPDEISQPESLHGDAITHALDVISSRIGYEPDVLVVLLGNTVYFKPEWVETSIKLMMENQILSAVVPVYPQNDHHPYRAKYIDEDGYLKPYFKFSGGQVSTNRQDLPNNYFLCHNFWTLRISRSIRCPGQQPWTFMGDTIQPIILERGVDVHEASDIGLCELWVKNAQ